MYASLQLNELRKEDKEICLLVPVSNPPIVSVENKLLILLFATFLTCCDAPLTSLLLHPVDNDTLLADIRPTHSGWIVHNIDSTLLQRYLPKDPTLSNTVRNLNRATTTKESPPQAPVPFYRDGQRVLLFLVTLALIIGAVVAASVLVKDNCHTNGRCKWTNLYLIPLGLGVLAMVTAAVWVQNAWARKWRHGQTVQLCIEKANKSNDGVVFVVVGDTEDDGGYGGMTMERLVPYEGGTTRVIHEAGGALRIEVHRKDLYVGNEDDEFNYDPSDEDMLEAFESAHHFKKKDHARWKARKSTRTRSQRLENSKREGQDEDYRWEGIWKPDIPARQPVPDGNRDLAQPNAVAALSAIPTGSKRQLAEDDAGDGAMQDKRPRQEERRSRNLRDSSLDEPSYDEFDRREPWDPTRDPKPPRWFREAQVGMKAMKNDFDLVEQQVNLATLRQAADRGDGDVRAAKYKGSIRFSGSRSLESAKANYMVLPTTNDFTLARTSEGARVYLLKRRTLVHFGDMSR
ncbi:hypothetical protein BJ742DRAFT_866428 [Cladochytrium replicatum]|nr:hypothetical protein BJ742DRAFT_866428 [Cladochytrium replicatum]